MSAVASFGVVLLLYRSSAPDTPIDTLGSRHSLIMTQRASVGTIADHGSIRWRGSELDLQKHSWATNRSALLK